MSTNISAAAVMEEIAASVHLPYGETAPHCFDTPSALEVFDLNDARRLFWDDGHRRSNLYRSHEILSLILDQELVDRADFHDRTAAEEIRSRGATVLFRGLGKYVPEAMRACQVLADLTALPVHANAFWSPESAQAFPIHSDADTVLVVQTSGTKRWYLFRPDDLSMAESIVKGEPWLYPNKDSQVAYPPSTADMSLVLRPGQLLVVPRGWRHYALAESGESLHISFGVLHKEIDAQKVQDQFPAYPG